jgi:hypothetical protein
MTASEVIDLPEPDSPTIPSDLPFFRLSDKFLTAKRLSSPERNDMVRFFISSKAPLIYWGDKTFSDKFKGFNDLSGGTRQKNVFKTINHVQIIIFLPF